MVAPAMSYIGVLGLAAVEEGAAGGGEEAERADWG
jgi:hypothetical protein